jgi:large subunit ribosomal protein L4
VTTGTMSSQDTTSQDTFQLRVKGAGGEDKGEVSLPAGLVDERVRYSLIKEAVVMYEANKRQGTHSSKTRAEIAGTTKKPWRQKGTGRARPGTKKSPIWKGGGVVFGPRPRDHSYSINRKQRQLATRSALFGKLRDSEVIVLEGLSLDKPSTKTLAAALSAAGVHGSCLVGTMDYDKNLILSARNLPGVLVSRLCNFNARDVVTSRTIVLLREAFDSVLAGDGLADDGAGEGEEAS